MVFKKNTELNKSGTQKDNKILLLGPNGQLGDSLQKFLSPLYDLESLDRKKFDFLNPNNFLDILNARKPKIVINAAAYTDVEGAELDEKSANTVNNEALKYISSACEKLNTILIHFSTDYVFDGKKLAPYRETDNPNPISKYGNSKLLGEKTISENMTNYLIFRTSGVISKNKNNFINKIIAASSFQKELKIVNDQETSLNHSDFLAEAIVKVLSKIESKHIGLFGEIYNLVGKKSGNWYEFSKFTQRICKEHNKNLKIADIKIIPVSSEEMNFKAERPKYSHLSSDKIKNNLSLTLPDWDKSILKLLD